MKVECLQLKENIGTVLNMVADLLSKCDTKTKAPDDFSDKITK